MNLDITVRGIDTLVQQMPRINEAVLDAHYFASINATERSRDAVRDEMRTAFDRPTPFILRSLRITSGSGGRVGRNATDRKVKLGFYDFKKTSTHDPVTDVMEPQVDSGPRQAKPMEQRLRSIGVLQANEFLVPSKASRRDRYGNIPPGEIVRMLSDLRAFSGQRNSRYRRRAGHYFVMSTNTFRGIFKTGAGRSNQNVYTQRAIENAQLVWLIVQKTPQYSARLPFYEIAERLYQQAFPEQLDKTLRRQLARIRS